MSENRDMREVKQRLEGFRDLLAEREVPESTRRHWRRAVRLSGAGEAPGAEGPGGREPSGWLRRPRWALAGYLAAVLILALSAVYVFPTVSLYAGSLPMVGPFFRMIGAD
ncbi:MAG: hypothetical protein R6U70_01535, partial [Bacillota bacterium]